VHTTLSDFKIKYSTHGSIQIRACAFPRSDISPNTEPAYTNTYVNIKRAYSQEKENKATKL
jgi:phage head maturation protease